MGPPPTVTGISPKEATAGMKTNDFKTSLATDIEDIQWQNFQSPDWLFWKRVVTNIVLFLITWGLTTPEHIAQARLTFTVHTSFLLG